LSSLISKQSNNRRWPHGYILAAAQEDVHKAAHKGGIQAILPKGTCRL